MDQKDRRTNEEMSERSKGNRKSGGQVSDLKSLVGLRNVLAHSGAAYSIADSVLCVIFIAQLQAGQIIMFENAEVIT